MASDARRIEPWWKADKDDAARVLGSTITHIRGLSRARFDRDKKHMRLYCPDVSGNGQDIVTALKRDYPKFNMIKQAVDTMVSQIATQRPKPQYIVTEGEFEMEQRARTKTRVLEGQCYDLGAYDLMPRVCLDAGVLGTGHAVPYLDRYTNEPELERCMPGEVMIDPRGAITGDSHIKYRCRGLSRDFIEDQWGVDYADLRGAADMTDLDRQMLFLPHDQSLDEVMVIEACYAPSPGKKKGRHIIATSNLTLVDEDWEYAVPLVPLRFQNRQVGYWGLGLAEIGCESQARLDMLLERIQQCQHLGSTVWAMIDERAKIRADKLTNEPCTIVRYQGTGNPPQLQVFRATPEDLTAEVERIRERFLSETGISVMSAEAKKPAGLNSAPAQRAFEDISSQRHQIQGKQYEAAFMELVKRLEDVNDQAQKVNGGYSVAARTQRGLVPLVRTVKWSEAAIPAEKYRLTCFPTSQLPNTISGRLEALQEWVASGFVSRPYAQKQVIDAPSDDYQQLELADIDFVMWQVEEILDGRPVVPEPYQHLQLAADTVRRVYLQVKSRGAPEEVLMRLRAFVDAAMPPAPPPPQALPQSMQIAPGAAIQPPALPGQAIPEALPS